MGLRCPGYAGSSTAAAGILVAVACGVLGHASADAQEPRPGLPMDAPCPPSVPIPDVPREEWPPDRCTLDRPPTPTQALPGLPTPVHETHLQGHVTVVVETDGSVHEEWTRLDMVSGEEGLHARLLEAIRAWRFQAGELGGRPVRSAFRLEVVTDVRPDTLPAELLWSHETHPVADTLRGSWRVGAPLPFPDPGEEAGAYAAVFGVLHDLQVIRTSWDSLFCLLPTTPDPIDRDDVWARLRSLVQEEVRARGVVHGVHIAGPGCQRELGPLRVVLGPAYRIEGGRFVVRARGDVLPEWPPGLGKQRWRAWEARCTVGGDSAVGEGDRCTVSPSYGPNSALDQSAADLNPFTRRMRRDGPLRMAVMVARSGAFGRDTLLATVEEVPRISQRGLLDQARAWCLNRSSMAVTSLVPGDSVRLVVASFRTSWTADRVHVVGVQSPDRIGPYRGVPCPGAEDDRRMALFLLGDLGEAAPAPIDVCMELGGDACGARYQVDPARHTLLPAAHLTFEPAALPAASTAGHFMPMRIFLDGPVEGLVPLVIADTAGRQIAWFARPVTATEFAHEVSLTPQADRYRIYLLRVD